jgi:hypothetical protein
MVNFALMNAPARHTFQPIFFRALIFAAKIRARAKAYIAQRENGTNIAQKAGSKQMTAANP